MIKVIHEVDIALRSLIEREATDGTEVEVVFDAPTKDWASRRNVPTIDVYLYDIREDMRRNERGLLNEYDDNTRVIARHLPPRFFKLSYLVTAWTQRAEDEHRLLSSLLACFLRHECLPKELLTGSLASMNLSVPLTIALPPPEDRSFADVWSALGGELKPSLDVVITAPTDTGQHYVAAPPVTGPNRIDIGGVGPWPPREARQRRNGSVGVQQVIEIPEHTASAAESASAASGASASAAAGSASAAPGDPTAAAAGASASAAAGAAAKPTRRRRQGGISHK